MSGQDISAVVIMLVMLFAVVFNGTILPKLIDKENEKDKKK
ncbi:MAG TPA: hypothetical protein VIM70_05990 [Clostridium sp.]